MLYGKIYIEKCKFYTLIKEPINVNDVDIEKLS